MKKVTAIILAAGMGVRLGDLTRNKPKALITVGSKTLLEHTIDFVKKLGVTNIVVVGGYCFEQVRREVNRIDSRVAVIENKQYRDQNLVSVITGLERIKDGGFFISNIDHLVGDSVVEAIRNNMERMCVYVSFDESAIADDVMKVKINGHGELLDISKKLQDCDGVYSAHFFCDKDNLDLFKKAARSALEKYGKEKAVTEHCFLQLIEMGCPLPTVDVGKADWVEVDTPEELALAEHFVKGLGNK